MLVSCACSCCAADLCLDVSTASLQTFMRTLLPLIG
jgi:hypothetical protein